MLTELRQYGDGKTIILYTEDMNLYMKLKDSKCFRIQSYKQKIPGHTVIVGYDLYFTKQNQLWVEKILGGVKWNLP